MGKGCTKISSWDISTGENGRKICPITRGKSYSKQERDRIDIRESLSMAASSGRAVIRSVMGMCTREASTMDIVTDMGSWF